MMTPVKGSGSGELAVSPRVLAALGKGVSGASVEGVPVAVLRPSHEPPHAHLHLHASPAANRHSTLLITARSSKGDAAGTDLARADPHDSHTTQLLLAPSVVAAQQRRESRSTTPDQFQGREPTGASGAKAGSSMGLSGGGRRWPWRSTRASVSPRPLPSGPSVGKGRSKAGGLLPDIEDVPHLMQELVTITNYTRAAYGYVMAAGACVYQHALLMLLMMRIMRC